jgi:hypothetical protein
MSATYQKPFSIPEGYPALLKAFTREILRSQVRACEGAFTPTACNIRLSARTCGPPPQPDNIYQFGAEYFAALKAEGADGAEGAVEAPAEVRPERLASEIQDAAKMDVTSASTSELESVVMREWLDSLQPVARSTHLTALSLVLRRPLHRGRRRWKRVPRQEGVRQRSQLVVAQPQ